MEYLASRLYKSEPIPIESLSQDWQLLAQEIEHIDSSTLRVWQTIQIIHENVDSKRVYSMNGQRQPLKSIAITASCYLRVEQNGHGTTFTIVANEKEALDSVRSLIECIYEPVQPVSLDSFLRQNWELRVLAARIYEPYSENEVFLTFGEPVILNNLVNDKSSRLISFSAAVDIVAPPLNVRTLYVNSETQQAGFSVETDLQDERILINRLFILVDRTFKGNYIGN